MQVKYLTSDTLIAYHTLSPDFIVAFNVAMVITSYQSSSILQIYVILILIAVAPRCDLQDVCAVIVYS